MSFNKTAWSLCSSPQDCLTSNLYLLQGDRNRNPCQKWYLQHGIFVEMRLSHPVVKLDPKSCCLWVLEVACDIFLSWWSFFLHYFFSPRRKQPYCRTLFCLNRKVTFTFGPSQRSGLPGKEITIRKTQQKSKWAEMCCPQMLLTAEINGDIHTNDYHQAILNEVGLLIWAILQMSILLSKKNQVMNRECGLRVYGVCVCLCVIMISFFLSLFSSFVCLSLCLLSTSSQVSHIELLLFFQSWPQTLPKVPLNFWSACLHFPSVWIIMVLCPVSCHVFMCELWCVHICAHLRRGQKTTSWSFFRGLPSLFLFWVGWYWIFCLFCFRQGPWVSWTLPCRLRWLTFRHPRQILYQLSHNASPNTL